jgi:cyclohexanecarboxylate-CoA ligase
LALPLGLVEYGVLVALAGLMMQKIPEQLEVVDELPRNKTLNKVHALSWGAALSGPW